MSELTRDAQLIRQEVERCREILQQMAARAGEGAGEMLAQIDIRGSVCLNEKHTILYGAGHHLRPIGSQLRLLAPAVERSI